MTIIRRGDIVTVQFRGDRARLAVVVRSDLWRQSENFTLVPLTGSNKHFKAVRAYIRVRTSTGTGTVGLVAETDRMQWVPHGKIDRVVDHLTAAEMHALDRGLKIVVRSVEMPVFIELLGAEKTTRE